MSGLPPRTADTMSDAISLSSPNGRMSNRAKKTAQESLRVALFGQSGLPHPGLPSQPSKAERLLAQARNLRELASRGMRPRAFVRDAERLEAEASAIISSEGG